MLIGQDKTHCQSLLERPSVCSYFSFHNTRYLAPNLSGDRQARRRLDNQCDWGSRGGREVSPFTAKSQPPFLHQRNINPISCYWPGAQPNVPYPPCAHYGHTAASRCFNSSA